MRPFFAVGINFSISLPDNPPSSSQSAAIYASNAAVCPLSRIGMNGLFCYGRHMKHYLAGGAVRNSLLGLPPTDLDYAFAGTEGDFIALNPAARKLGGGPTIQLGKAEYTPLGKNIEENLRQRDFTINSFLLEENGVLHMHPDALDDLKGGVIHPASTDAFVADHLRIFRAARFCSCFPDFTPSSRCLELMRNSALLPEFENIAPERVGQECIKALDGIKPGNFIRVLSQAGCLGYWFQEFEHAENIPAGPPQFHQLSVLEHIAVAMDEVCVEFEAYMEKSELSAERRKKLRRLAVWMSLCHDLGKVNTPEAILPSHYLHETRGIKAAEELGKRIRLPNRLLLAGTVAARLHMKAGIYKQMRPGTRVDLLLQVNANKLLIPLFLLAQADSGDSSLLSLALDELKKILPLKLPVELQNKGKISGERLREMRCLALPRTPESCHF